MRHILLAVLATTLFLSACGETTIVNKNKKADGAACTEDDECTNARCLDGFCRARCESDVDCKDSGFVCSRGGCIPYVAPDCGNGVKETGEECDDGNDNDADECSNGCIVQSVCGNGVPEDGEECDDGNEDDTDECTHNCTVHEVVPAWSPGAWSACSTTCGTGTHSRSVECHKGAEVVDDTQCTDTKPATSESCTDNTTCSCTAGDVTLDTAGSTSLNVPPGCSVLIVEAWGGGGAGGVQVNATGGGGGYASAQFTVTPNEPLTVEVGEGGQNIGDGGGASSVFRGSTLLLIAGAGGGGGNDGCSGCTSGGAGGAGGGDVGQAGLPFDFNASVNYYCQSATPGLGGTQSQGGQGGTSAGNASSKKCSGGNGSLNTGGGSNDGIFDNPCNSQPGATGWEAGGSQENGHGGAGGAGWYGGGGGGFIWTYCGGGGGGGSSHVDVTGTNVLLEGGSRRDQAHPVGAGTAGLGGLVKSSNAVNPAGANGRVILHWGG